MALIKIESGYWLKNASLVGFLTVLERMQKSIGDIKYKKNYIEFDSSMLDGFEEEYFKTLIEKNEKNTSWYNLVSQEESINKYISQIDLLTKSDIDKINDIIDQFKTKLKLPSYQNAYLIIENSLILKKLEKKLSKIKVAKKQSVDDVKQDVIVQLETLAKCIDFIKIPSVKRIIAAKNVMYDIVQPFWTNISFLHNNNNKKNMYELYKSDFIDTAKAYIDKDKSKFKYTCFSCGNKISKLSKPEAYDLTWLVKTGVDMKRKSSHFWNMNGDAYICPICNLVYSCLPLGFISLKGKGIFINSNHSIKALKQSNVTNKADEKNNFQEIEQLSYFNILNSMENYNIENLDKEFENIQVIKIDMNNSSRPYSFNVLSKRLMKIMYYHRNRLSKLIKIRIKINDKYSINLYDEVINRLYNNKKLYDLISELISFNLQGMFYSINSVYDILIINNSMGGINMKYDESNKYKNYGLKLKNMYAKKDGTSKLAGITYRLLNALKTKDSARFMDILINAYMYMKSEIPVDFIKALNNQDMLQSVGYAFLIGLQGSNENKEANKDEK